jgi:hypothetical protein
MLLAIILHLLVDLLKHNISHQIVFEDG